MEKGVWGKKGVLENMEERRGGEHMWRDPYIDLQNVCDTHHLPKSMAKLSRWPNYRTQMMRIVTSVTVTL